MVPGGFKTVPFTQRQLKTVGFGTAMVIQQCEVIRLKFDTPIQPPASCFSPTTLCNKHIIDMQDRRRYHKNLGDTQSPNSERQALAAWREPFGLSGPGGEHRAGI